MQRRQFLIAGSALSTTLMAGCTGETDDGGSSGGDGNDESEESTGNESENGSGSESEEEGGDSEEEEADAQDVLESEDSESTTEGLEITEHELYEDDFTAGVEGVVANNTGDELGYVEVGVVFYNSDDQRIDDSFTNTTDLPDGEEWVFDVMFLGDEPSDIDHYTIGVTDSPF